VAVIMILKQTIPKSSVFQGINGFTPLTLATDMRIVPLGSGGGILDLDWFLKYWEIRLVIKMSEIEGKDDLLAYFKH
jgi:hypothetical protein